VIAAEIWQNPPVHGLRQKSSCILKICFGKVPPVASVCLHENAGFWAAGTGRYKHGPHSACRRPRGPCGVACARFSKRARTSKCARKRATVARRWSLRFITSRTSPCSTFRCPCWNGSRPRGKSARRRRGPEVMIFTLHDRESEIRDVLHAGARGYVLKSEGDEQIVAGGRGAGAPPTPTSRITSRRRCSTISSSSQDRAATSSR